MSIDVNEAKIRAGQLTQYKFWLENSRRKMLEYKNQINTSWSGVETAYINTAISRVIDSLEQTIREMDEISMEVVKAAREIRAEELESERQQKIQEASNRIKQIENEIRQLKLQKEELEELWQNSTDSQFTVETDWVIRQLRNAERDASVWKSRLNLLRRQE